jgi:hypothetical protein
MAAAELPNHLSRDISRGAAIVHPAEIPGASFERAADLLAHHRCIVDFDHRFAPKKGQKVVAVVATTAGGLFGPAMAQNTARAVAVR